MDLNFEDQSFVASGHQEQALSLASDWRRLGGAIKALDAGERIDSYLARAFPFLSRAGWQKRIEDGTLHVNARATKPSARLKEGDTLRLYAPLTVEPEIDRGIRMLWREGAVMAVFKPGNLPMHENGAYRKNTFAALVSAEFGPEWSAAHRLDRETSGIVICGATPAVRAQLSYDFNDRKIKKEYLAIARGVPPINRWTVDEPIGDLPGSRIRIKKWVREDGLDAITHFMVADQAESASLLLVKPETGRTNQIRVHAAYSGHELIGDKLYHTDEEVFLEYFERGTTADVARATGFPRCCLHAAALELRHPETTKRVRVECELPPDLAMLWSQLKDGEASIGYKTLAISRRAEDSVSIAPM